MKLFNRSHDGGKDSGVTGYWLVENKRLFSIVLLRFSSGSREAFHSHAFNALTWWVKGEVEEQFVDNSQSKTWKPSFKPKFTPKGNFHKIIGKRTAWAISVRGKWDDTWQEKKGDEVYTLTSGRVKVQSNKQLGDL